MIESTLGVGTTVRILLPRAEPNVQREAVLTAAPGNAVPLTQPI
jgi:hypothetical protein